MQRFLLDTHVLLWWLVDSPELVSRCRQILPDAQNNVFVSAASTWETVHQG